MGRILGVLCLSGLRFFLGGLFFCEEHLYILLRFHQFLHLVPRLSVGWIIIFKIVDFPQRRTPVRIFTKGVSVYAIIWFTYKGLSIIGIASYLG